MKSKCLYCCFEKEIIFTDQQPAGFQTWTEGITYKRCKVTLPDNSSYDIRIWLSNVKTFDSGAYTSFLVNRYKETL